jgi:hypothetical protein
MEALPWRHTWFFPYVHFPLPDLLSEGNQRILHRYIDDRWLGGFRYWFGGLASADQEHEKSCAKDYPQAF